MSNKGTQDSRSPVQQTHADATPKANGTAAAAAPELSGQAPETHAARPAEPAEPRDELRCTLCGLRACWTS